MGKRGNIHFMKKKEEVKRSAGAAGLLIYKYAEMIIVWGFCNIQKKSHILLGARTSLCSSRMIKAAKQWDNHPVNCVGMCAIWPYAGMRATVSLAIVLVPEQVCQPHLSDNISMEK